jgi:hypothetical protein
MSVSHLPHEKLGGVFEARNFVSRMNQLAINSCRNIDIYGGLFGIKARAAAGGTWIGDLVSIALHNQACISCRL